ncbi:MAG: hypothetical protein FWF66_00805 [Candidatus Bathyarchaeota archaeon]|nr:hypothetical protein [Candidatus Termiticorpusculum sp.]
MYDPVVDVWTAKTGAPANEGLVFSCGLDNKIISVGNFQFYSLQNEPVIEQKILFYDPDSDVWREGKPLATSIQGNVAVGITTGRYAPQKIYILSSGYNVAYDPIEDTWMTATASAMPRSDFGVVVVDDILYVIGGLTPIPDYFGVMPASLNEQYVPIGYDTAFNGSLNYATYPETSAIPHRISNGTAYTAVVTLLLSAGISILVICIFAYCRRRKQ